MRWLIALPVVLLAACSSLPPLPDHGKDYQTLPLCLGLNFDPSKIKEYKRDFNLFGDFGKSEQFQAVIGKIIVEGETKSAIEKVKLFEKVVASENAESADVMLHFYGKPRSSRPSRGDTADFYGALVNAAAEQIGTIQFTYRIVKGEPANSLIRALVARQDAFKKEAPGG